MAKLKLGNLDQLGNFLNYRTLSSMKYCTIYILHTLSQYGLVPSQIFFSVWGICTGTSNTGTVALNSTVQL